jgi:hypothetical protein
MRHGVRVPSCASSASRPARRCGRCASGRSPPSSCSSRCSRWLPSKTVLIRAQDRLDDLNDGVAEQDELQRQLALEVADLQAPERIVQVARDRMGMIAPHTVTFVEPTAGDDEAATYVPPPPKSSPTTTTTPTTIPPTPTTTTPAAGTTR